MNSQKLEDILNLSLDSTVQEREKSLTLNVGFDEAEQTWELIVRFHEDLSRLNSERVSVEVLLAGYAIVTLPESLIPALTQLDEIEYVEKPRELLYNVYQAKRQSCFPPAGDFPAAAGTGAFSGFPGETEGLTGAGCLVAVFDSGIDYFLGPGGEPDPVPVGSDSRTGSGKGLLSAGGFCQGRGIYRREDP